MSWTSHLENSVEIFQISPRTTAIGVGGVQLINVIEIKKNLHRNKSNRILSNFPKQDADEG